MDLRFLTIALPLWALIAPAVCAANCGPAHFGSPLDSIAENAAPRDSPHCHAAQPASTDAQPGEQRRAAGNEPTHNPNIDCCDEITAEVAQHEAAPRTTPSIRVSSPLAGSIPANFAAGLTITPPCTTPPSPYSRANPPLLI